MINKWISLKMNIKNHIIKHFIKFKVVHSIPGRLRLKVNNASKIPQEAKEYDKYVVQGLKMLDGIKDVEFNYITGSVVITYDTKKTYEEKIVKWINKVIDIVLGDFKLIEENGQDNLEFVIDTLEQKLNEAIKTI